MIEGRGVYDETMAKATQINTNENVKAYYAGEYKGKTVEELRHLENTVSIFVIK